MLSAATCFPKKDDQLEENKQTGDNSNANTDEWCSVTSSVVVSSIT